jgi:hypothetical protein
MLYTTVFLVWLLINIIFLANFNLAAGYLVIVNLVYAVAAMLIDDPDQDKIND